MFVDDWTLVRQSLPQHHISSESDYAPGHPALDALTRLQEQLEAARRALAFYDPADDADAALEFANRATSSESEVLGRNATADHRLASDSDPPSSPEELRERWDRARLDAALNPASSPLTPEQQREREAGATQDSAPAKRRLTPEAEKQWREMVNPYLEPDQPSRQEGA